MYSKNTSYWPLSKALLNCEKIPCIPPLFHGKKNILNFEKKRVFNYYFADQCSPISDNTVLTIELLLWADSTLSSSHFLKDCTSLTMNNLHPSKCHGYNKIRICMLKVC